MIASGTAGLLTTLLWSRIAPVGAGVRERLASARPAWDWVVAITVAAALCPLPYALVRLTWFTPWAIELDERLDSFATRIQGASLGVAGLVGAILTLGLVSRRDRGHAVRPRAGLGTGPRGGRGRLLAASSLP